MATGAWNYFSEEQRAEMLRDAWRRVYPSVSEAWFQALSGDVVPPPNRTFVDPDTGLRITVKYVDDLQWKSVPRPDPSDPNTYLRRVSNGEPPVR